jgi:malate permease and related proteins
MLALQNLLGVMLNVIGPIFLVLGVSYFISKRFNPDPHTLSPFLIYVFAPALVFKGIYQTELSGGDLGRIALTVVGVVLVMMALATVIARLLNFSQRGTSALILTSIMVNAGNYGIPLNTFAFGAAGGSVAIVYYVVSAMMGNILGVFFASRGKFSAKEALLNVVRVPIAYAAVLGLIFNLLNIKLYTFIERAVIDIASGASIPLMLALLGLHLARVSLKRDKVDGDDEETLATDIRALAIGVGLKLLVAPFVAVGFALLLGMQGTVFDVAVVESSMPTAILATALATQFGGDARYITAVTIISTLASIVTLSILILLLGGVTG